MPERASKNCNLPQIRRFSLVPSNVKMEKTDLKSQGEEGVSGDGGCRKVAENQPHTIPQ